MARKSPEVYFDNRAGSYWLRLDCNRFLNLDSRNVKLHLMRSEFHIDPEDSFGLKAGDRFLTEAQMERWVDYAGPLSGHNVGMFTTQAGGRVLVTSSRAMLAGPKKESFPNIERFLAELFGQQAPVVLFWLKMALSSLEAGDFRPGQLLVLAGPSGCGKSLFQALVTQLLGGRSAKPYRYMVGETQFNSDLAAAEHLVIEDENASADIRSRRKFGSSIKEFTVNTEISVHAKGRQAISLPTYKRLTLSVNDEPENLMILPPMDSSLLDKVTLLRCSPARLDPDRSKTWRVFMGELPAFGAELRRLRVPRSFADDRFGVKAWHDPDILEILSAISPEHRLDSLIGEVLFKSNNGNNESADSAWTGSAEELEKALRSSSFCFAVERLLYFSSACGVYLQRLANKFPGRFEQKKNHGKSSWTIKKESHD